MTYILVAKPISPFNELIEGPGCCTPLEIVATVEAADGLSSDSVVKLALLKGLIDPKDFCGEGRLYEDLFAAPAPSFYFHQMDTVDVTQLAQELQPAPAKEE